jgi:hypothetical protein
MLVSAVVVRGIYAHINPIFSHYVIDDPVVSNEHCKIKVCGLLVLC